MSDKAIQKSYTKRYLPEKAWASLSKDEREETDRKKREGSKKGKQFIPNTERAKKAGKAVRSAKMYKEKKKDS
jgi:thiazole synthase ThiGH ThiG subunit